MGEDKQDKSVVEVLKDLKALVTLAGAMISAGAIVGTEDYINGRLDALAGFIEGLDVYINYYSEAESA